MSVFPLIKDDAAELKVDTWREEVRATPDSIKAALLHQLADKHFPGVSIYRSDRHVIEVNRWSAGYTLRIMNFEAETMIIRKAWWAVRPSYHGRVGWRWFEMFLPIKQHRIFSFDEAASLMLAFVDGRSANVLHKWVPEHQ